MKINLRIAVISLLFIYHGLPAFSQSAAEAENSDEPKIIQNWKTLQYKNTSVPTLRFPQRRFDSPLFCDESFPFKDGLIINSTTSSTGRRTIDIRTSFYYLNLKTKKLFNIFLQGVDTIESVISDNKGGLICSYKEKNRRKITVFKNGRQQDIFSLAALNIKYDLDTAAWIKLGFRDNALYALSPAGVYLFSNDEWKLLTHYSLLDIRRKESGYHGVLGILPTNNIVIGEGCIWFLQEIVQERRCNLLKLDLASGKLSDFFIQQDYTDNYVKEVNDFSVRDGNAVLVSVSRTLDEQMVLGSNLQGTEVWVFENAVNTPSGKAGPIEATALAVTGDTTYLAGTNGLFLKNKDNLTPLMFWENTHQEIIDKKITTDFPFFPRSLKILPNSQFLVGGMWGGLYLIDSSMLKITCLDDISDEKIKGIDIRSL